MKILVVMLLKIHTCINTWTPLIGRHYLRDLYLNYPVSHMCKLKTVLLLPSIDYKFMTILQEVFLVYVNVRIVVTNKFSE